MATVAVRVVRCECNVRFAHLNFQITLFVTFRWLIGDILVIFLDGIFKNSEFMSSCDGSYGVRKLWGRLDLEQHQDLASFCFEDEKKTISARRVISLRIFSLDSEATKATCAACKAVTCLKKCSQALSGHKAAKLLSSAPGNKLIR